MSDKDYSVPSKTSIEDDINKVQDLVDKEDFDGAAKLADKILNLHKETLQFFGRVYDRKALALNKQDRPLQALKYNDMAVTLYYDDILCHGNRSYTLERLGRFEEAVEEADIAISLYPNLEKNKYITEKTQKDAYANALNNKGYYLYKLGKPEEGLKFVEEALELDPTNVNALDSKEEILEALDRTD